MDETPAPENNRDVLCAFPDDGFSPGELRLPYHQWCNLVDSRKNVTAPDVRRWLAAWDLFDLMCSPMDDNERGLIRYGHYLGWFDRQQCGQHLARIP